MHLRHLVPNAVTLANIVFGFLSVVASAEGRYEQACLFIFFAALCDMSDGKIARLLNATSKFGMELDSLSDAISFGLAPGVLVYFSVLRDLGNPGMAIAVLYALCGVLRLARFNVDTKEISKVTFLGCPIPAAAGYIGSFVLVRDSLQPWVVALGTTFIAFSMVSTIKVPKFSKGGTPNFMLLVSLPTFVALLVRPSSLTWHVWNGWNLVMLAANYVLLYKRGYLKRTPPSSVQPAA
ncbi:MAG: CDP-diacylglycerol--serine O-phosphatidyltransferase [Deltaproteobacteria bacterium]|nr:CDP-diacylglycerol--serine O-phosphatidyltransferase [Deltaproteobacteria bacterium]